VPDQRASLQLCARARAVTWLVRWQMAQILKHDIRHSLPPEARTASNWRRLVSSEHSSRGQQSTVRPRCSPRQHLEISRGRKTLCPNAHGVFERCQQVLSRRRRVQFELLLLLLRSARSSGVRLRGWRKVLGRSDVLRSLQHREMLHLENALHKRRSSEVWVSETVHVARQQVNDGLQAVDACSLSVRQIAVHELLKKARIFVCGKVVLAWPRYMPG
jgi:hypothetical protein